MDSIEQKKVHNVHVKRVVQKLAHSVKAFCVTRILEQVMANLLNDEKKLFRVHGDGAGPVANLTGRSRQYRRPDYTGTGEAGCEMYGTGPAGHQNFMPRTSLIVCKQRHDN
jgi:hypothetical protein